MNHIVLVLTVLVATTLCRAAEPPRNPHASPSDLVVKYPERRELPGQLLKNDWGEIFIPDFFNGQTGKTDLVVWFSGTPWCVEQNFYDATKNAVLVVVRDAQVDRKFDDPARFRNLLIDTAKALAKAKVADQPFGRICLGVWGKGLFSVRSILQQNEFIPHITDVVIAHSLLTPTFRDGTANPKELVPYIDYAKRAAKGDCTLLISVTYLDDEKHQRIGSIGNANLLIAAAGAERKPTTERASTGESIMYRADLERFHIFCWEAANRLQNTWDHLFACGDLLKQISFENAK